jgi:hypothetical protein
MNTLRRLTPVAAICGSLTIVSLAQAQESQACAGLPPAVGPSWNSWRKKPTEPTIAGYRLSEEAVAAICRQGTRTGYTLLRVRRLCAVLASVGMKEFMSMGRSGNNGGATN